MYTQRFVTSRKLLQMFANYPFRLLEVLEAAGHFVVLHPNRLPGKASPVHEEIVAGVVDELEMERVAKFLSAVTDHSTVAVTTTTEMQ